MDTLRGNFAEHGDAIDDSLAYDLLEDDTGSEAPPETIGQDERRMQVRAYNHWASLLEDRTFPSIEDLEPENLPDFGPYSVLLDFTEGIENPGVSFLGNKLAGECGSDDQIERLSDVPARSLLSRITDHYMQIIANQAPIGFEAEFVNQRGQAVLYRGILLPFSSDDDTIDFIFGVINWKELADQLTTDELMLQIDQALDDEDEAEPAPPRSGDEPITDWADGPASGHFPAEPVPSIRSEEILDFAVAEDEDDMDEAALPRPHFGFSETAPAPVASLSPLHLADPFEPDVPLELVEEEEPAGMSLPQDDYSDMGISEATLPGMDTSETGLFEPGLSDLLAAARDLAEAARASEDRTRSALYAAIGRAYDFSLAAAREPDEYRELVEASGLTMQDRAPMTPVVKLVFGANYDKTRLTEYAAALGHAHRLALESGTLADFLEQAEGGLKGVVAAERRLRREEAGKPEKPADAPRARIAKKLRKLEPQGFEALSTEGHEFGLVVIRRLETGEIAVLGEVSEDAGLIERAAKELLA